MCQEMLKNVNGKTERGNGNDFESVCLEVCGSLTWIDDCPLEPLWPGRFACPGWRSLSVQRGGWYESIQTSLSARPWPGEGLPCLTQDCTAPGFHSKWGRAHCSHCCACDSHSVFPGETCRCPGHFCPLSSLFHRLPLNSSSALEPEWSI